MGKKILIVDDNEGDRVAMREILDAEFSAFEFELLSSGEEAVEKFSQIKPDIVILDTRLTGMNGFDVCRKIRAIDGLDFKVIVMTGLIDAVDAVKAREAGADDYCVKTAEYTDIVESVKSFL